MQVSSFVLSAIDAYGCYGIFVGMSVESIGMPLPSEIILPYAGHLAYLGNLNLLAVVLVGTSACLTGSLVTYFIAFFGGNYLFERYDKYLATTHGELRVTNEWFDKYGKISIFVSRMVPGVRAYSSVPAGIYRMDLKSLSHVLS